MFYRPEEDHGLPHNPFYAVVTPRPIGWISTRGPEGDNLAPYSFFNAVCADPPQVVFAGGMKDSVANAQGSGVFAVNIVEEAMMAAMNASSAVLPRGVDEFAHAGVEKAECVTIDCPRVGLGPATLECRVMQIIPLKGKDNYLVTGEVTGIHLREDCLVDGVFDVTRFHPVARLGYKDYALVERVFAMERPR